MSSTTLSMRDRESQDIKMLTTRVIRVENRVDTLNTKVDSLNTKVDRVDTKVDRLDAKVNNLDAKVNNLDAKVNNLDAKVNNLDAKVNNLDAKVNNLDAKVDRVDAKVDHLDAKLDAKVDSLRTELRNEINDLGVQLRNEMSDLRVELKSEMSDLRGEIRQVGRNVEQLIGHLGSRWGIYNESIWRQTIASLIEGTYGGKVEERFIEGEQFDVVISNGDHILLEITARFRGGDLRKVQRKRQLYTTHVQPPSRVIVAAAHIHSRQAIALQNAGFEIIEPEDEL